MAFPDVVRLVKSLSSVEKRQFKLATKKQAGRKDYLDLFNIIDQCDAINLDDLKEKFKKTHPGAPPDNAAKYLLHLLTDNLILTKIKKDRSFQLLHGLMRIRILEERSITKEAHKELRKIGQKAASAQDDLIQYLIFRKEMEYLSHQSFRGTTEKQLIELQMTGRGLIKNLHNIHEHQSLYELLKYRLMHSGKILSEGDKKRLNDLILNEIGLVTGRIKRNFESQKLHLLFQSFFFTDTGDYKSALKTFYSLNRLFEQNTVLWENPPVDYLTALDGILDSLRANGYYEDMEFYISKMEQLNNHSYPEYFHFLIHKTVMIYKLVALIGNKRLDKAVHYIKESDVRLLKAYKLIDDEKQNELSFYISLIYFMARDFKKAHKYINEVVLIGEVKYHSVIYRACRLLNILIYYEEKNDLEYLDYEIRSYKRPFQKKNKLLKTEKLVLKIISMNPDFNKSAKNNILWGKISPLVVSIEKDRYEKQILKYYDFVGWARKKFGKRS